MSAYSLETCEPLSSVLSDHERTYRRYFHRASENDNVLHIRAVIQGLARGFILQAHRYRTLRHSPERKTAFDAARESCRHLMAAHKAASVLRPEDIPGDLLNPELIPTLSFRKILGEELCALAAAEGRFA